MRCWFSDPTIGYKLPQNNQNYGAKGFAPYLFEPFLLNSATSISTFDIQMKFYEQKFFDIVTNVIGCYLARFGEFFNYGKSKEN